MATTDLRLLRRDLAERSKWNLGYFVAGLIFWCFVLVVNLRFPLETARVYWLVGSFFIFPLAVVSSFALKADPFGKANSLGELVGYTHMSVIALTFPLVIAAFLYFPQGLLLVMAIAYCVDFYVMSWAFGTQLFGVHAASRTVLVTIVWFALPSLRLVAIPAIVALAYFLTVMLVPRLRRRWLSTQLLVSSDNRAA